MHGVPFCGRVVHADALTCKQGTAHIAKTQDKLRMQKVLWFLYDSQSA
ncbi:hypothetical protein NBRC116594_07780 [Shimia sp. NS0008-38b]